MFENGQLTVLNINDILPNRFQPRIKFDGEKLEELADSITKYGVIQPIVVRPVSNKYEIIAGERRFKASKLANKSTIPAIIVNLSDKDSEEIALLENIQRQQLSPIEEAVSYKRILDMGYITQEELAKKIGKAQSTIANKIRLLNLDDEVQSYLLNNKISERHARSLLRIPDKEKQVEMLHKIVEERLTVKQTDKEIEKLREETKIENRPVKPVTIDIQPQVNNASSNEVRSVKSSPEDIESLFDEVVEDIKPVKEERGNGSMDIEKIMREAKDINMPQEAPKDISGLMQPGNDVQSEPIVREEPVQNPNLEPSKFISVAPQPEPVKPVQQPANNVVTFDSMFTQPVSLQTPESLQTTANAGLQPELVKSAEQPVTQSTPSVTPVQETVEPVAPSVSTPVEPVQNPGVVQEPSAVSEVISDDTKQAISSAVADALKRYNENKAKRNNNEVSSAPAEQPVIQPVQTVTPVQEVVEPVTPNVLTPVESVQNVSSPVNEVAPTPIPEPSIPNISEPVSEVEPSSSTLEASIPSTDIIADDALNEYAIHSEPSVTPEPTMASTISQDVKPVANPAHFAQIVKMLRDCADKIEQNGYFVNVDELDLGSQYKVTFTINKE